MINPKTLDAIPHEFIHIMQQLQAWTISDIARRIVKTSRVTDTAQYQLARLNEIRMYNEELQHKLAETMERVDDEIDNLFRAAAQSSYAHDARAFEYSDAEFVPYEQNAYLQQLVNQFVQSTQNEMRNITRTLAFISRHGSAQSQFALADAFQNALDFATMQITTGVTDYNTAIKNAVDNLASSGIVHGVPYVNENGRKTVNRVNTAVRRAVFGGIKNMTRAQSQYNANLLGTNVYEISWHSGHRPSHDWGGKRYIDGERMQQYPNIPTARELFANGSLDDYGCLHDVFPVMPDMPPTYTAKQLRELEQGELVQREFEGKQYNAYQARQKQREIERGIRAVRLKQAGYKAALDEGKRQRVDVSKLEQDYYAAKIRNNQLTQRYEQFSEAMQLPTEYERVYYDGLGRLAGKVDKAVTKGYNFNDIPRNIKNGTQILTIKVKDQNRHIKESGGYIEGRSYIYGDIEFAQELVHKYAGTGRFIKNESGNSTNKEVITANSVIGVSINVKTKMETETKKAIIHYSKKGTHIVPTLRGSGKRNGK